jgi:hypothetical protein
MRHLEFFALVFGPLHIKNWRMRLINRRKAESDFTQPAAVTAGKVCVMEKL